MTTSFLYNELGEYISGIPTTILGTEFGTKNKFGTELGTNPNIEQGTVFFHALKHTLNIDCFNQVTQAFVAFGLLSQLIIVSCLQFRQLEAL